MIVSTPNRSTKPKMIQIFDVEPNRLNRTLNSPFVSEFQVINSTHTKLIVNHKIPSEKLVVESKTELGVATRTTVENQFYGNSTEIVMNTKHQRGFVYRVTSTDYMNGIDHPNETIFDFKKT